MSVNSSSPPAHPYMVYMESRQLHGCSSYSSPHLGQSNCISAEIDDGTSCRLIIFSRSECMAGLFSTRRMIKDRKYRSYLPYAILSTKTHWNGWFVQNFTGLGSPSLGRIPGTMCHWLKPSSPLSSYRHIYIYFCLRTSSQCLISSLSSIAPAAESTNPAGGDDCTMNDGGNGEPSSSSTGFLIICSYL